MQARLRLVDGKFLALQLIVNGRSGPGLAVSGVNPKIAGFPAQCSVAQYCEGEHSTQEARFERLFGFLGLRHL